MNAKDEIAILNEVMIIGVMVDIIITYGDEPEILQQIIDDE